tara:strand:- start:9344 stop:11026 length:1683 start_codon:yes stop_codon:yes gene_type:complete
MLTHNKQINIFIEQLVKYSIKDIVISPGSRSTPLVNNFLKYKKLFNLHLVLDERSAAFFALGKSKISKKPSVLICTSGTATLNYSPAIAESFYSQVPLIIITSDRPMNYRETGSNQTLDQNNIYKNNINWFFDIPITNKTDFISNIAYKAIYQSQNSPQGPVHINWQFEEPFTSEKEEYKEIKPNIINNISSDKELILDSDKLNHFLKMIKNKNGLILVGSHKFQNSNILKLSRLINWPIIADPLSNLRDIENYEKNTIIDTGDIIFRSEHQDLIPETVIHIGSLPVSKFISKKLEKAKNHIFIEPSYRISHGFFKLDLQFHNLDSLVLALDNHTEIEEQKDNKWKKYFENINYKARKSLEKNFLNIKEVNYKNIILSNIPKNSFYISGNSLPIRILDIILTKSDEIKFIGNRGLSGIDGNISIASGVSAMTENNVFLDLGDLAFIHDIGGLITAKRNAKKLTIFINNNGGGQIFNLLPQSKDLSEIYEDWFITPHQNLNIRELSRSLGCDYFNPKNKEELKDVICNKLGNNVKIVEMNFIKTDYLKYNSDLQKVIDEIS